MNTEAISRIHIPVMLAETMEALAPHAGGRYLDGTIGLGGHAEAILAHAPDIELCGLDRDNEALQLARQRLGKFGDRVHLFHMPYSEFPVALNELGWECVDGALLDLGVSSFQLDNPHRGFSFRESGPLDMRMDADAVTKNAWHLVNRGSHTILRDCIAMLGEEPQAGRIAKKIIEARQKVPINDTASLADIILHAYPPAWRRSAKRHPATRTFQALRMAVNDELGQLEIFLNEITRWLAPGGRVVIISFHSLEDRLVKRAMKEWAKEPEKGVPSFQILYKKPLVPGENEIASNPRASSAKFRAALRVQDDDK